MPQHFLLSSRSRTISAKAVMRWTEERAYTEFLKLRWPETDGRPVCPHCGHDRAYDLATRRLFKCARRACHKQFSATSGTLFHGRKMEYRDILAFIVKFVNAKKGTSAIQMAADMGLSVKCCYVLMHKLREAIDHAQKDVRLEGVVEVDGSYHGGHRRPPNKGRAGRPAERPDRKQCVLVMTQRDGDSVAVVIPSENTDDVVRVVGRHVEPGSEIHADEHGAYNALHAWYECHRINHAEAWSRDGASTNRAEAIHSRMRRAVRGQYHRVSGRWLQRYAAEITYRHDRRRTPNGSHFAELASMAAVHPASRDWKGRWQRRYF